MQRDIDNCQEAMVEAGATAGFMTAASPGIISFFLTNRYYPTLDAYHEALVNVMRHEYEAIANAGFDLQLDCPDLTGTRQSLFADASIEEYREMVARHVELVNEATKNISPERMRMHLCWRNYEGPHHRDVAPSEVVDIILMARPQVISFEAANPRHAHEWVVWEETELPEDKVLMPGVIDSTTNFIEHPELVAQRLVRFAHLVGKEGVIAGVDCGFGTNADLATVDPKIAWAKLRSLTEGADLASSALWPDG